MHDDEIDEPTVLDADKMMLALQAIRRKSLAFQRQAAQQGWDKLAAWAGTIAGLAGESLGE